MWTMQLDSMWVPAAGYQFELLIMVELMLSVWFLQALLSQTVVSSRVI